MVPADVTRSPFYGPFAATRPQGVTAADWAGLQSRAREVISGPIAASYRAFSSVAQGQLVPKCRKVDSVATQPQGKDYYAALARYHTTTDLTPDHIHQIGLQEVARIRAEMEAVAKKAEIQEETRRTARTSEARAAVDSQRAVRRSHPA